jgi:hypothetical protein
VGYTALVRISMTISKTRIPDFLVTISAALSIASGLVMAQQARSHGHRSPAPTPPTAPSSANVWHPTGRLYWQWQLTTPVDLTVNGSVFDIDMFDNDASVVAALHAAGRKAICYVDFGSWESWRPDAASFPASVKGTSNGWPGEQWLDIRQLSALQPIMGARLDLCKAKGFDAVEPDNIDGYSNPTGFLLTYQDQINYNQWIANAAHARGLSVGLKNDLEQAIDLQPYFDWALDEQCFQYKECAALTPFVTAGKTVFEVEYKGSTTSFCPTAGAMGLSSMAKHLNLDAWKQDCP